MPKTTHLYLKGLSELQPKWASLVINFNKGIVFQYQSAPEPPFFFIGCKKIIHARWTFLCSVINHAKKSQVLDFLNWAIANKKLDHFYSDKFLFLILKIIQLNRLFWNNPNCVRLNLFLMKHCHFCIPLLFVLKF